ncbi:MAG: thiosulfate oxidation carrier complex protein SoxZ [candidate division WOR-3 bacterium]|nr:thiosulfate oxidation carrier complex protein SoxZ [candidate division WOR-3 bacterium]MDH5684374.1 thiosulfate oxidation carrier complex protein SoxZ [candidate division WOR-3 bacterium]
MKHLSKFLYLAGIICFFITSAIAHPPDSLELNLDSTGILSIKVFHTVKDEAKHYITKIVVELNGKEIIQQSVNSQVSKNEQHALYRIIDAQEGDKITVTAICNITGKKKETLMKTAPEKVETEKEE